MKRITTLTIITVALFLITVTSHQIGCVLFGFSKFTPNVIFGLISMVFIIIGIYYSLMIFRYLYNKVKNLFR